MTYDHINPNHYKGDRKYEPIDVIEDWGLNYHLGNALKYIARSGRKPGEDIRQGLGKAVWYLERYQDQITESMACADDADELIASKFAHMVDMTFASDFKAYPDFDYNYDQEEVEFDALGDIPSSVLFGSDEFPVEAAQPVPFFDTEDIITFDDFSEEIYKAEADYFGNYRKDLSKFEDQEIVTTHRVGGAILGTQKNGDVRVLGKDRFYEEIKKAEPQDLAPSEYEDPWNYEEFLFEFDR